MPTIAVAAAPIVRGNVHLDATGKYTVSAGDSTNEYGSLREALDAALPTVATHEKQARLRSVETGDLNGAWRWLPATDVEPAAIGGVRIDAQAIHEMADSLNARPGPIPIDGGPTPAGMLPSDVHGTASTGGGTPANGWAHWGVVVDGPAADQAKLYLYSELVPEVAREVDAGRIATGSVHFGATKLEGELPRGVELISHALTNDPAVKTLAPANSVRGQLLLSRSVHQGVALRARNPEKTMANKTNLRGPAMDAEAKIFALFGVDPNAADADCQVRERLWAVMNGADQEEAIAAVMGGGAPPAATASSAAFRTKLKSLDALIVAKNAKGLAQAIRDAGVAAPAPAQRAPVAGLADEPAKDAWITQMLAACTQAGLGDGTDAAASLSALQGAADQIKGALGASGDQGAGQMASASEAAKSARAEINGLKSELATVQAERSKDRAKLEAIEKRELRRTLEDRLDEACRAAGRLPLPKGADREAQIDDLVSSPTEEARGRLIALITGQRSQRTAPTGEVMGNRSGGGEGAAADGETLAQVARREFLPALKTENEAKPKLRRQPNHFLIAEAQRRAAEKYPHLVDGAD